MQPWRRIPADSSVLDGCGEWCVVRGVVRDGVGGVVRGVVRDWVRGVVRGMVTGKVRDKGRG